MTEKRPILIWRIQDMPAEVEETLIEDGFHGDKGGYRKWLLGKSGDEFIVLVPNEYLYDDREVAEDLGVVSVGSAAGNDEPKYIDDLFTDLHYNEEKRNTQGYHAFVIPELKRRKIARRRAKKGSEAGGR
jgi:hypothetical protein